MIIVTIITYEKEASFIMHSPKPSLITGNLEQSEQTTNWSRLNCSEKFLVWVIHHWAYERNENRDPLPKVQAAFEALGFGESTILTADIFSEILSALFASSTVKLTVGCPHNLGTVEHFLLGYLGFLQSKQQHIGKELLSKCLPNASLRLVSNRLNILGKKLTSHNFKISVWPEHLDMLSRATGTTNEKTHNIIIH
ncbi:MAG: hypothetical protein ACKVJV_03795 [Gammaproteobacteria bacterium]|jgi:hypothetical protein